jgi:primosomal protein N' (replication factor Y) (superfamily II helicase)
VRTKREYQKVLGAFAAEKLDILVGTQMVAKGHDFQRVTLVGVVSADLRLGMPDFRAAERTFQLLTQVAGRAGRGELPGEVLVESFHPEHYAIQDAARQDFEGFFEREVRFRWRMCWCVAGSWKPQLAGRGNSPNIFCRLKRPECACSVPRRRRSRA